MEVRSTSHRESDSALIRFNFSKIALVSLILLGGDLLKPLRFVGLAISHHTNRILMEQLLVRIAFVLNQHLTHGFGRHADVLERL